MRKISVLFLVNIILVVIIGALLAQQFGSLPSLKKPEVVPDTIDTGAKKGNFTQSELQTWLGIKDRLAVVNTDPDFPDPDNRILGWYSMRNSSSGDYYQKSMEFLMFWEGQGANGEWEAVISIYNSPNSTTDFIVEVSRFTWHSLEVTLNGNIRARFSQVTNDTTSLGYATFRVVV